MVNQQSSNEYQHFNNANRRHRTTKEPTFQQKSLAKVAYFYREGDQHFAPIRIVLNRRRYLTMESLMSDLTDRIKLPRGVRAIYTPQGRNHIFNLDQLENEGSYVCSSHLAKPDAVDLQHMLIDPNPFIAAKGRPDYVREDSRFIRTGLPADEPSDEELPDVKSRLRKKQERRQIDRLEVEEKMRGKNASWAERVRRLVFLRNGEPNVVKNFTLTTATGSNMYKIKSDLSAMFGLPVERIYNIEGRLVLDVEDLFRNESAVFIASFGDHFKPMAVYQQYANVQSDRDLARINNKKKPLEGSKGASDSQQLGLRRYDTVVLPPMDKALTLPKAPTFNDKPTFRKQRALPPLAASEKSPFSLTAKRSKEAPAKVGMSYPVAPDYELPPVTRLRSKTMVLDRPRRKVKFESDVVVTDRLTGASNGDNKVGHSRRSRLGQQTFPGEPLPVVLPSMTAAALNPKDRRTNVRSLAVANDIKKKRLQRSRSEILAEVQGFTKKTNAIIKRDNTVKPPARDRQGNFRDNNKKLASGFVKMRKKDHQSELQVQVWAVRVTTGDLPAGVSTSSITLTVYGERGKSKSIPFTPASKVFMPRSIEHFTARINNIGDIFKIRLEADNSGPNPDWRCETVVMENGHTGEKLEFPCRRWLSQKYDDKQTVREIPALSDSRSSVPLIRYDVIVHTGNVWNAATVGTVTLEVYGDRGDSGARVLHHSNHGAPFAKGQVDMFPMECVALGDLRFIRLRHDPGPSGIGWFVENVVVRVRELDVQSQFIFPISRWLNPHEDDGAMELEVRPVDLSNYMKLQDAHMWPFERWKFTLPGAELMFYSCTSHKPLRITASGFIDARSEAVDISDGYAVFNVASAEGLGHEDTVALRSTAARNPAFVAFSQRKIVSKAEYSAACDLRVHVLPSRALNLESEKFPNTYVSVLSSGQLQPEAEHSMPGPPQAFYCYVKGLFRDGGTVMLCTSKNQTLSVEKDPSVLTALGKRNKLAHFRVHKSSSGGVRMFESVVFTGSYLQIRKGICNAAGNGDRYCEFKIRKNREESSVTIESLRERGCFVGFTNAGSVYPLVDASSSHPNATVFPEVIEFGRRSNPQPGANRDHQSRNESRVTRGKSNFRLEQQIHKTPRMWAADDAKKYGLRQAPSSPYRSQVRQPKPANIVRRKPVKKEADGEGGAKNRFDELSKPRVINARRQPSPKKPAAPKKAPPPPRVANLPPRVQKKKFKKEGVSEEQEENEKKSDEDENEEKSDNENRTEDSDTEKKKEPVKKTKVPRVANTQTRRQKPSQNSTNSDDETPKKKPVTRRPPPTQRKQPVKRDESPEPAPRRKPAKRQPAPKKEENEKPAPKSAMKSAGKSAGGNKKNVKIADNKKGNKSAKKPAEKKEEEETKKKGCSIM